MAWSLFESVNPGPTEHRFVAKGRKTEVWVVININFCIELCAGAVQISCKTYLIFWRAISYLLFAFISFKSGVRNSHWFSVFHFHCQIKICMWKELSLLVNKYNFHCSLVHCCNQLVCILRSGWVVLLHTSIRFFFKLCALAIYKLKKTHHVKNSRELAR